MSQSNDQQPRGDFVAFLNRDKQPGDKRPLFDGHIAKPDSDAKRPFALWPFRYTSKKTGEVFTGLSGHMDAISTETDAMAQIEAMIDAAPAGEALKTPGGMSIKAGGIVLFKSQPKEGSATENPKDFYGYANFGDNSPLVDVAVWADKTRTGHAMLSGKTQYPRPTKVNPEMESAPTKPSLADQPLIPFYGGDPIPPKAKSKGRGGRGD